jgi:hypothetical protein
MSSWKAVRGREASSSASGDVRERFDMGRRSLNRVNAGRACGRGCRREDHSMARFRRVAAACACSFAFVLAGTAGASAGMKPQKISGKVELVNMGKHAFSTTALSMHLIYVTSKTKFVGIKNLDAIKKGQTIHATVLHQGAKYTAISISNM